MPNTLIHIAIQAPISRALFSKAEIPWILAGIIIPDLPWIIQRIALSTHLVDPFQIRLYCTVQASLLFCLFLCATLAFFSRYSSRIFFTLSFNCFLHLILDASQIKWGNGVHLFAPFNWQLTNFGLLWPEHILGYCAALFAIIYLLIKIRKMMSEGIAVRLPGGRRRGATVLLLVLYLTLPLAFMGQLEKSNSSHIQTLRNKEKRAGKSIELDRERYSAGDGNITIFSGESFTISGNVPIKSGIISLQGQFTTPYTIRSYKFHIHNNYRNYASYIGLLLSLTIWSYLLFRQKKEEKTHLTRWRKYLPIPSNKCN